MNSKLIKKFLFRIITPIVLIVLFILSAILILCFNIVNTYSDPESLIVDTKWGPMQRNNILIQHGYSENVVSTEKWSGSVQQDITTDNKSNLPTYLANSTLYKKLVVNKNTLYFNISLFWDANDSSEIYLGLFFDGKKPLHNDINEPDGKPQTNEFVAYSASNRNESLYPDRIKPVYHLQRIGIEQPREDVYNENTYLIVIYGHNVSKKSSWIININVLSVKNKSEIDRCFAFAKDTMSFNMRSFYSQKEVLNVISDNIQSTLNILIITSIISVIIAMIVMPYTNTHVKNKRYMLFTIIIASGLFFLYILLFNNSRVVFIEIDPSRSISLRKTFGDRVGVAFLLLLMIMLFRIPLMHISSICYNGFQKEKQNEITNNSRWKYRLSRTLILIVVSGISIYGIYNFTIYIGFITPGLKELVITSYLQQDYPVAITTQYYLFAMISIIVVLSDAVYVIIEPRINSYFSKKTIALVTPSSF